MSGGCVKVQRAQAAINPKSWPMRTQCEPCTFLRCPNDNSKCNTCLQYYYYCSCNKRNARARAHTHTHTHTGCSLSLLRATISVMSPFRGLGCERTSIVVSRMVTGPPRMCTRAHNLVVLDQIFIVILLSYLRKQSMDNVRKGLPRWSEGSHDIMACVSLSREAIRC